MADLAASPAPAQSTGQSPPGSSPATMPVPNRGQEAAGMALLNIVVNQLLTLAPKMGVGTDVGRAVLKAANDLAKYVPPGTTSQGVENAELMKMMRERQQGQQMAALAAAKGAAGAGAPPVAPPPSAGTQA